MSILGLYFLQIYRAGQLKYNTCNCWGKNFNAFHYIAPFPSQYLKVISFLFAVYSNTLSLYLEYCHSFYLSQSEHSTSKTNLLIYWPFVSLCKLLLLLFSGYVWLCNPMDCSLPGTKSMGFPRQEYWSGLPFPSPGDLPCQWGMPKSNTSTI